MPDINKINYINNLNNSNANKTNELVTLAQGSGGKEMSDLIGQFNFFKGEWKNSFDDSATLDVSKIAKILKQLKFSKNANLVFTTDSFIVSPIFFPDANIGHIAFCGTVNDLCVMGASPLGLSLSFVIEEGFQKSDLKKITQTIAALSNKYKIPIVTGDTKVMEKGKIDKIVINTAGIGIVDKKALLTKKITPGDKIIISGGIGEHAVALLSKRFDYRTNIVSDSKPLVQEVSAVKKYIKYAKDPTRGGIASILNEIAKNSSIGINLEEKSIPIKEEVKKVTQMLGINPYELACEGRFVCFCEKKNAAKVLRELKKFNHDAAIIGEVTKENKGKVIMQTYLGTRIIGMPSGRIVPRIC